MALTYVYLSQPSAQAVAAVSGTRYTATAAGFITGVTAADALSINGVDRATLQLLMATGTTTERPRSQPATALTGAINNLNPPPFPGLAYYDTTLSAPVWYVGTQQTSTGWADRSGVSA